MKLTKKFNNDAFQKAINSAWTLEKVIIKLCQYFYAWFIVCRIFINVYITVTMVKFPLLYWFGSAANTNFSPVILAFLQNFYAVDIMIWAHSHCK